MLQIIVNSWNDRLLRLAFLCIMLMGIAVAAINPFQSVIGIERLGFSNAAYALVTTVGALFSMLASVAVGIYTDQTGRYREFLMGCTAVGIVAASCVFFLPAKATFVLAHMVLFPIASTTFTQYFAMASLSAADNPKLDKDVSLSLVRAAFAGAFGLTPPVLAIAVAGGMDLLSVYGFVACINVFVLLLVARSWPRDQSALNKQSGLGFFASLKEVSDPAVMIRLALVAIIIGVNALYNILLGLLILNNLGGSESDVGWFAGGVALVEAPVMLLAAAMLRKVTRSGMIFVGVIIYASFIAILASLPGIANAWIMIIPGGIGAGILLSVTVGYVQDLMAKRPGAGSALVSVSHFGGTMFAAGVFAASSTFTDYAGVAWIGCVLALMAGLVLFLLDGGQLRKGPKVQRG